MGSCCPTSKRFKQTTVRRYLKLKDNTMKKSILIALILILVSFSFSSMALKKDYSYQLTIISTNGEEQKFNVEIRSTPIGSSEAAKNVLLNQTTPFEKDLESGVHIITVEHLGEHGGIESKIVGILDGETKGSAWSDDRRTILKAGPGGRYSAGK